MSISELFIRRPVMTTLMMAGLLLFGVTAYRLLPVSELPSVDFPTLLVSASLPGANPDTMASTVATPLEREFSTIAGLDSMTSASTLGNTQITLQFDLSRDLDGAGQDVLAAISRAQGLLPPEMPSPPSFQKVNPADQPILYVAVSSPTLPLYEVDEYAETLMAQRISMVSGVAQVQVFGSQKYAVRVQVNPDALAAMGIGLNLVQGAITGANVNVPTGTLHGDYQAFTIMASGQLTRADAYRSLILAYRNGAPVYVEQIGRIIDSVENDKIASWHNTTRAIVLAIRRQPGTNTVQVVDAIRRLLPSFRNQIPASVTLDILYDRSESIRHSVGDLQFTLLISMVLVVLVIFLFLRNVSATIIPSLALPLSIIGTFAVMHLLGYSLDTLSLMALTLCVGFVVDDAIVVLENIVRHAEMRVGAGFKPALAAALDGSREISFTILSMTLSLAAVFIPLLFMGGIMGRLLHEFSVTITTAILISGAVSLSLSPMLCSRFLKPPGQGGHHRLYLASERFFARLLSGYEVSLTWVLKHGRLTLAVFVITVILTAYLFVVIPKDFIPSQDTGQIFGFTEAAQDISFDNMVRHQQAVMQIVGRDPAVEEYMSAVGAAGVGGVEQRVRIHPSQAPLAAPAQCRSGHSDTYAQAHVGARHAGLSPEPARDSHRRTTHEKSLPIHAAEHRYGGTLSVGPSAPGEAEGVAAVAGGHERSADCQSAALCAYRPRPGGGAECHGGADRRRAVQRLWHPADLNHLCSQQRLPGDSGGRAAISEESGIPFEALYFLCDGPARAPRCGGDGDAHDRTAGRQP